MKKIDLNNWDRLSHYNFFKDYEIPHLSVTNELDVTKFVEYIKTKKIDFFKASMYVVLRSINEVENFRYRVLDGDVVLFDKVGSGFTFMKKPPGYCNCYVDYNPNQKEFLENLMKITQNDENILMPHDGLDVVYMSFLPWGKFTSVTNPYRNPKEDTIPRILWNNAYKEGDRYKINFSVQAHHSFIDGYHINLLHRKLRHYFNIFRIEE